MNTFYAVVIILVIIALLILKFKLVMAFIEWLKRH